MDDDYENIEEYNPNKQRKTLIIFDDMLSIKKINLRAIELFIKVRKQNMSWKNIRLNSTHYFIMGIPNKRELQQIAFSHLSDIGLENFMNFTKMYCKNIFSFLSYWYCSCIR